MKFLKNEKIIFISFLVYAVFVSKTIDIWEPFPFVGLAVMLSAVLALAWDMRYLVNRWVSKKK